jgi:hypothetical protein
MELTHQGIALPTKTQHPPHDQPTTTLSIHPLTLRCNETKPPEITLGSRAVNDGTDKPPMRTPSDHAAQKRAVVLDASSNPTECTVSAQVGHSAVIRPYGFPPNSIIAGLSGEVDCALATRLPSCKSWIAIVPVVV